MFNRLSKIITSDGFRESVITTIGNFGGTAISGIALIFFSRALGPDNFGVFSTAFALALLIAKLADFGFNLALQRELAREGPGKESLIQTVLVLRFVVIVAIVVFGLALSPYLTFTVFKLHDPAIIQACVVLVGITIGFDFFTYVYQAQRKFILAAILIFAQALLKLAGAVGLYLTHQSSPLFAVIIYLVSPVIGIVAGLTHYRPILFAKTKMFLKDLSNVWASAKWISLSVIATAVAEQADVLITKANFSNYDTGQFAAAARLAMFLSLIGASLTTVLSVRVARYRDPKDLQKYLKKAVFLAIGALIISLSAIPFGYVAILLTVGDQYLAAVPVLSYLFVATALANATAPLAALFYVFPKPQYYTYTGLILIIGLIGLDLFMIPQYGIMGAGVVRIIIRFILLIFSLFYVKKAYAEYIQSHPAV